MSSYDTSNRIKDLMEAYVPEFTYSREAGDPGSVLTTLCGDMLEESARNYDHVLEKHKIQFLNLFDSLVDQPVSKARGYVQFEPVAGYEGDIFVPSGATVLGNSEQKEEFVYATTHDLAVTNARPKAVIITDQVEDTIIRIDTEDAEKLDFHAFSLEGKNQSHHQLYLCFEDVFDFQKRLDFVLHFQMDDWSAIRTIDWKLLGEGEEAISFPVQEQTESGVHLCMEDYIPVKNTKFGKTGYFLVLEPGSYKGDIFLDTISLQLHSEKRPPESVYVNGVEEAAGSFYPFGSPLGLYNEAYIEEREVFSKKGAQITLNFELSYRIHQEKLELPEDNPEYRLIMKKPQQSAELPVNEVRADYVVFEYLSETGWKRIWKEEHMAALFNGTTEGSVSLTFSCPYDLVTFGEAVVTGRIRMRLLRAENIYKVPAVYQCPVISGLELSYSYEESPRECDGAVLVNGFEVRDITRELQQEGSIQLFYNREYRNRCMYMEFDLPPKGMPVSIYFDLENYSGRKMKFDVEYYGEQGFTRIRGADATQGFISSGSIRLLLPEDMVQANLYGQEGYFIRLISQERTHPDYALAHIHGIYMNMAKIELFGGAVPGGRAANLDAGQITVMGSAIRYVSGVNNPFPLYGGEDDASEAAMWKLIQGLLYTRNRGVTEQDIYYLLSGTVPGICQVKCQDGRTLTGQKDPSVFTVAILMEEYKNGMQAFMEKRPQLEKALAERSAIAPLGRNLEITQPQFVRVHVRAWLEKKSMEQAYEVQHQALELIHTFLDPVKGGTQGRGFSMGTFPQKNQLLAFLKTNLKQCDIARISMTAELEGREYLVEPGWLEGKEYPFILPVNGEHIVHINIVE